MSSGRVKRPDTRSISATRSAVVRSDFVRSIKNNRFLYAAIAVNVLAYSVFFALTGNSSSFAFNVFNIVFLAAYVSFSEFIISVAGNDDLNNDKSNDSVFSLNVIVTSGFIALITLFCGNPELLYLCLIPLFHTLIEQKGRLAGMVMLGIGSLILLTGLVGWFDRFFLPANNVPGYMTTVSFLVVFGCLGYLIYTMAKTISRTIGKADYLHNIATTDALTGLVNRRAFNSRLSQEFARAKRHKSPLSLALFDIDFFKKINDTYGHGAGDAILRELGKLISSNIRTCDIAARYGGEEFVLILPETTQAMAYELMDRIRKLVEMEIFNKNQCPIKATISIGVAQLDITDKSPLEFCERADKALYKAKESGRNRVENATFGLPQISYKTSAKKKAV
ncbi:MAG: GGDEF domain-containing protein [Candidatus Gastranaerophilales bacterium]|nr:GGDEF domain-containing protein [Candidatus Gastranaerophilales bacterium]